MTIQIFGTNKCQETRKAQRFFKERGIPFQMIDLREKGFSRGELNSVLASVGGLDVLLDQKNKSFCDVRYLLPDAVFEKVLENPSYLRTPVVRNRNRATVGYEPEVWKQWMQSEQADAIQKGSSSCKSRTR